jgi:hypothetical protein
LIKEGVEVEMALWFTTHTQSINLELAQGRSRPLLVGAFKNATVEVVWAVRSVPLNVEQLRGEKPVWVGVPVIKTFGLDGGEGGEARRPRCHHFILVGFFVREGEGAVSGGTGKTCNWMKARVEVGEVEVPKIPHFPHFLLRRQSHIHQHTRRYRCCASVGVDVSTGIKRAGAGDGKVGKEPRSVTKLVCAVQGEVYAEGDGDENDG